MTKKLVKVEIKGKLFYGWREEGITRIYFTNLLTAFPMLRNGTYSHYLSSRRVKLTHCTPRQRVAYCRSVGKDSKNLSLIDSKDAKKFYKYFTEQYKPQKRKVQKQIETQPEKQPETQNPPEAQEQLEKQNQPMAAPFLHEIFEKTKEQIDKIYEIQGQTLIAFKKHIRTGEPLEFSDALKNYNVAKENFAALVDAHDDYLTVFRENIQDLSLSIIRLE